MTRTSDSPPATRSAITGPYVDLLRTLAPEEAFVVGCLIDERLTARQVTSLDWDSVHLPSGILRLTEPRRQAVRISPLTAWSLNGGRETRTGGRETRTDGRETRTDRDGPVWPGADGARQSPRRVVDTIMQRVARAETIPHAKGAQLTDLRRARAQELRERGRPHDEWRLRALRALQCFQRLDSGDEGAHSYAFAAGAAGWLEGWTSDRARRYLERLFATRNPDGGFGLGRPFDAFSTGRQNPADTTYTVTLAGHVGPVLLEAHAAGAVRLAELDRIVGLLVEAPRVPVEHGMCIGYSLLESDASECVNNVNALVGSFLDGARRAGSKHKAITDLLAGICKCHVSHYRDDVGSWSYIEGRSALNDFNHDAATIQATLTLAPPIGRAAGRRYMLRRDYGKWTDPLGQVRLARYFSSHRVPLLDAFDAMLTDERVTARLAAQFAYWSAHLAPSATP
jgi:hypothetical protein